MKHSLSDIKRIVFLDIDNTLFLSREMDAVIYTGFSADRWCAFVEALKIDKTLVGIVTYKDRGYLSTRGDSIYNGLPDFPQHEIFMRYDDICRHLFNYDKRNKGLVHLLVPELIYFLNYGEDGTKARAMDHAHQTHLEELISKENIWIIDDMTEVKTEVEKNGYQFHLVPPAVYQVARAEGKITNSATLEKACIDFMLTALETLGIQLKQLPRDLLKRITHCEYSKIEIEDKVETSSTTVSTTVVSLLSLFQSPPKNTENKHDTDCKPASPELPSISKVN